MKTNNKTTTTKEDGIDTEHQCQGKTQASSMLFSFAFPIPTATVKPNNFADQYLMLDV